MGCSSPPKTNSFPIVIPQDTIIENRMKETRFKKIKSLGHGAFGEVFLIKSKKTEKEYALKEIELSSNQKKVEELITSIKREIINLRNLDHPNIISIKAYFKSTDKKKVYIITDYAEGGDLGKEFEKHRKSKSYFEEDTLLNWIFQICFALQYSHEKNIIHRDIKPVNIFLMKDETVKLGDFGLSKQLSEYALFRTSTKNIGTLIYTAPEIIKGEEYSFPADIWSLGVTFCQLMSLNIPFKGNIIDLRENIIKNIKNEEILNKDKTNYNDEILNKYTSEFIELIDWMMTIDKTNRPTAQQILESKIVRKRMSSFLKENVFNSDITEINNYIKREEEKYFIDFGNENDDSNLKIEDNDNEDIYNEEKMKINNSQKEKIRYDFFRQMTLISKSLKKNKTYKQKNI